MAFFIIIVFITLTDCTKWQLFDWLPHQSIHSVDLFLPTCPGSSSVWQPLSLSPHCTSFDPSLLPSLSNLSECLSVGSQTVNAASNEVYASVSMWGVNKEAAQAITHQQAASVCVSCVCMERVLGASLAHLTAVCRPTGVLICSEKAGSDEFWSTEGLCSACLSGFFL